LVASRVLPTVLHALPRPPPKLSLSVAHPSAPTHVCCPPLRPPPSPPPFLLSPPPPLPTRHSQMLVCRPDTPVDAVLHFLDAVRAMPHIRFCLLNVDALEVTVRDRLVGCLLDPEHPTLSMADRGLVLAFRTQTGLDAFNAMLEDVTPGDLPGTFVKEAFAREGLQSVLAGLTLVAGRAGKRLLLCVCACLFVGGGMLEGGMGGGDRWGWRRRGWGVGGGGLLQ
jgi:hypothetical protein